jgi:hypothetical protein
MRFMGNLKMAVSEQQLGCFICLMHIFSVWQWCSVILSTSMDARKFPKYDFINKWFRMFQDRCIAKPQASGRTNRLEAALCILMSRSRRKIRRHLSWRLVLFARGARRVRGCTCKRVRSYWIAIEESWSLAMRPSNAFHCYMVYVGKNGAGHEFVIFFGWVSI